jgi:hypothetical protein
MRGVANKRPFVELEFLAMPTNGGAWLDDDEGVLPARPEPVQRKPEGAVQRREPGLRSRLGVRRELLAPGKLDDRLLPVASEEGERTAKKQHREVEQSPHGGRDSARCSGVARV